jgi:proteasome assembly chaperone (PAC2) family protein
MPRDNVVWTYVIENTVKGQKKVTDFFSVHRMLQWCISDGCKYEKMYSAFLYYYGSTENDIKTLVLQAMHTAKDDLDCDAFSIQVMMGNDPEYFGE